MKGKFIAFEGIDGCGKTTQLNYLANWLPQSGLMPFGTKLQCTREPGGTPLGKEIRKLLLHPPERVGPEPLAELLLYASDRAQHVCHLIRPALERGDWVISDRFSGSTMAYQGFGRNLDLKLIQQLEEIATGGLAPDLTFLLDIPIQESMLRRCSDVDDRMEAEGFEFLERVSNGFSVLAASRQWISIKADQHATEVSRSIKTEILMHLDSGQRLSS